MAGARGRTAGFRMSDEHRVKIQNSNILNALIEHVTGNRDMSATQVSAGVALLRKVLPDLSAVEHSGNPDNPVAVRQMTDAELLAIAGSGAGVAETTEGPLWPN